MTANLLMITIAAVFLLMAYRAIRSGSRLDNLLAATQILGVIALLTPYRVFALYLLLATAAAYLASQLMTGARRLSRLLPVGAAALILLSLVLSR